MAHKDAVELRKAALLKIARTLIRVKHAVAADEELNEVLPKLEKQFNAAVSSGLLPSVADILSSNGLTDGE